MAEWWVGPTTADQCGHIPEKEFLESIEVFKHLKERAQREEGEVCVYV